MSHTQVLAGVKFKAAKLQRGKVIDRFNSKYFKNKRALV